MIPPTIGRKVWYYPSEDDLHRGMVKHGDQPFDATVVFVHSDTMINVRVCDHNGDRFVRTPVLLLQDDLTAGPDVAHCAWMPYQVGQAARHAADSAATSSGVPGDAAGAESTAA